MQTVDALKSWKARVLVVHPQDVHPVSIPPMPLEADGWIRCFSLVDPIGEGIGWTMALLNPQRNQRMGKQTHLRNDSQKRRSTTKSSPLGCIAIVVALKRKFLPMSPHPTDFKEVVNGQTQRTAAGTHSAGQDIAKSGQTRQTGCDGLTMGKQGLKHIPHPTTTTNPDGMIGALPGDPIQLRSQIKRALVEGCCH
jgi:hypothetical protein